MTILDFDVTPALDSDIQNPDFWPLHSFYKAYGDRKAVIINCSEATLYDHSAPEKTALIVIRTFIERGRNIEVSQKYVLGIHFCSFGDMAIIDVISLDHLYHRDMAYEHVQKFNWPILSANFQQTGDKLGETTRCPFVFVGGYLRADENNNIDLSGGSSDYTKNVFFSDSNNIVSFIISKITGFTATGGNQEKGALLIRQLLEIMFKHRQQPDFYEQLIEAVNQNPGLYGGAFTSQHIGGLMMMKVQDRLILEKGNKDFFQLVIDEMTDGLGRYILVSGVARQIRQRKKE